MQSFLNVNVLKSEYVLLVTNVILHLKNELKSFHTEAGALFHTGKE